VNYPQLEELDRRWSCVDGPALAKYLGLCR